MEEWNLPGNFQKALRTHMDLPESTAQSLEAGMLHMAGCLTRSNTIEEAQPQWPEDLDANVWAMTGLTGDCLTPVLESVQPQLDSVLGLILQVR